MRLKAHLGKTDKKQAKVYDKDVKGPMQRSQGAEQEGHEDAQMSHPAFETIKLFFKQDK